MKKVALYSRVSTLEQKNEGHSLEAQKNALENYATAMGYTVVGHYSDGGFSGSNLNRPSMNELMLDVGNNKIDMVIVYKLDRLSRSQKDTLYLIEDVFLENNVDFMSLQESIDTSTPFGKAMIGILSVFAQLELANITERMKTGRHERVRKGFWNAHVNVPLGYDYKDNMLIQNEYAPLIKEIFDRFINGESAYAIYKDCYSRYPDKIYGNNMITRIIDNKIYTGKVNYNEHWYEGLHEGIVDDETFETAQTIRKSLSDKFKVDRTKRSALLARKIACGKCGESMSMFKHWYSRKGVSAEYGYYRCNSKMNRTKKHKQINCDQKNHRTDSLHEIIIDTINGLDYEEAKRNVIKKSEAPDTTVRLEQLQKQEKKLIDLYQFDSIDKAELEKRLKDINQEKKQLNVVKNSKNETKIIEMLNSVKGKNMYDMTFEEQCALVDTLIDRIIVKDDNVDIHFSF
jgi:site-specific DNA recombinase